MSRFILLRAAIITLVLAFLPALCSAAIVVDFISRPFDQVEGSDFVLGSDRITGRFFFDAIGDTRATSISLSATLGGAKLLVFDIPDVTANPLDTGITVSTNLFGAWSGGLPTQWDVTVFGNVFRGGAEEQISIHSSLGDLAAVDLGGPLGSTAITLFPGTVTAVPEPSSLVAICVLLAGVSYRHRKSLRLGIHQKLARFVSSTQHPL